MKKLMILAVLIVFCTLIHGGPEPPTVQAEDNWAIRGQGGIAFSSEKLESGDVVGTAQFSFLRLVWANNKVAVGGSYWDLNKDTLSVESYLGKIYIFSRNLKDDRFQAYLFTGTGLVHGVNDKFGEVPFNGGFGLLIPIADFVPFLEFEGTHIAKQWHYAITTGLQIGLEW